MDCTTEELCFDPWQRQSFLGSAKPPDRLWNHSASWSVSTDGFFFCAKLTNGKADYWHLLIVEVQHVWIHIYSLQIPSGSHKSNFFYFFQVHKHLFNGDRGCWIKHAYQTRFSSTVATGGLVSDSQRIGWHGFRIPVGKDFPDQSSVIHIYIYLHTYIYMCYKFYIYVYIRGIRGITGAIHKQVSCKFHEYWNVMCVWIELRKAWNYQSDNNWVSHSGQRVRGQFSITFMTTVWPLLPTQSDSVTPWTGREIDYFL